MSSWKDRRQRLAIDKMPGRNDGEKYAAWYLKQHGYQLLEQNYFVRFAEIDIIAQTGKTIVFVEVKHRSGTAYGRPSEFVTPAKQQKIRRAAQQYIASHTINYQDYAFRFDVIEIIGPFSAPVLPEINHIPNAF